MTKITYKIQLGSFSTTETIHADYLDEQAVKERFAEEFNAGAVGLQGIVTADSFIIDYVSYDERIREEINQKIDLSYTSSKDHVQLLLRINEERNNYRYQWTIQWYATRDDPVLRTTINIPSDDNLSDIDDRITVQLPIDLQFEFYHSLLLKKVRKLQNMMEED